MPATPDPSDASPEALRRLALDLSIHWSSANDGIWRRLDSELWELTANPYLVLNAASAHAVQQLLADAEARALVEAALAAQRQAIQATSWFQDSGAGTPLCVGYFSMEYMLSEALPIYSGGLGNVAGDQLKAASDLGVPVTGVGMLWQQGYFRQEIDDAGRQQAMYPINDTRQMPVEPLLDAQGTPVRLAIRLPGLSIWLRGWQARVGRNRLLLLDANDPANPAPVRLITSQLYGGDNEMRLRQELVLGIGGWRLLQAAGLEPDICHLNDGHAAFAVLERARSFMQAHAVPFAVALSATRAGNLFTTHTPVAAGFDRFPQALIARYLGRYVEQELQVPLAVVLGLGRIHADDPQEPFNMAYLATRCAGAVNAVSRLHGQTSRRIFQDLFPRWPVAEVPIGHVTNGIHLPMWMSASMAAGLDVVPSGSGQPPTGAFQDAVARTDDAPLWELRQRARAALVDFVRRHVARSQAVHGAAPEYMAAAGAGLDPQRLTLGFARRFATYKRPNLLLHDPDRLLRLLTDPQRPLQLLVAGKAHPADSEGQEMLQAWHAFIARPEVRGRVVFLEDYDLRVAQQLVQGVDVWVNTPRRPWEASGTSGMKVLANGGLNLSQRDGWWAEACEGEVGWSIGDGQEHDASNDAADALQLYELLENEIIPDFYARTPQGIPQAWLQRVRRSMGELVPRFTAERAVGQYTRDYYLPGASAYRMRTVDGNALAIELAHMSEQLRRHWPEIGFARVQVQPGPGVPVVEVALETGALAPGWLQVQMYAEGVDGQPAEVQELRLVGGGQPGTPALYRGSLPGSRSPNDYTARVIAPPDAGLIGPLELPLIAWQR